MQGHYGRMTFMKWECYEDHYSPVSRRLHRVGRALRWRIKSAARVPRYILVELRWRLGDEIMALPVFESLRARYPADYLAVLTHYPELFESHPFVDAVNIVPRRIDQYLLLRSGPRDVFRLEHYARTAGVALPVSRPHLYYRDWRMPILDTLPEGPGPLIAVATGASWRTKRWPLSRWRAVCESLAARGCRIVALGTEDDESIGVGLSLLGKTTVREAACVLHAADLLICCDSGLMHLCLAAAKPLLALFGPTNPSMLIRDEPNFHCIRSAQPCSGWWNKPELSGAPGECPWEHVCCLDSITPETVLERVAELVALPKAAQGSQ